MPNTVTRTENFVDSIGVNAHLDDSSTTYATNNVAAQLSYLGISNVRANASNQNLSSYLSLGQQGIKFDLIATTTNLSQEISWINSVAPYVISVEGPNEINVTPIFYKGLSGAAAADAYQADLYHAIHSDAALSGVKVLPFSLSVGASEAGFGNVSAYADEGNVHAYAGGGSAPYYMLGYETAAVTTVAGKPTVITETGYYTQQDGYAGVTQDVQAKWLMDTLLQDSADGVAKTYLYELDDLTPDSSNSLNDYGLFTASGQPKQAAIDIHNLTSILADTGSSASSFTPVASNFVVTGLPPNHGFDTVFAKSNGSYDVALWSEPDIYNESSGAESAVTPSLVTVALGGAYDVSIFDPVIGTAAIGKYTNVTSVQVALATDPIIVEVTPTSATIPAGSNAGPVSLGTGSSSILINMSEDAWAGDATFTLAVDGTQIGGVQAATASHSLGQTQAFTLHGDFTPGAHTITVTFLDDANSRSSTTDRNLYVDSISAGGATKAVNAELPLNESQSFTATLPTLPTLPTPPAKPITGVTLGAGGSSIVVDVSEDAWMGDAQFTLAVDGAQIGGVQTAAALHSLGQTQAFTLDGDFGPGAHTVTATFLNDAYGGTSSTDRNLYVDSIGAGGATNAVNAALMSAGSQNFTATLPSPPTPPAKPITGVTLGVGGSSIVIDVSEDAWMGDAQFTLAVDGAQIGGVQTAAALHSLGQTQAFTLDGDFGPGAHTVTATFLNDAYGGTSSTDRNLYVDSIGAGGATNAVNAALMSAGSQNFTATLPSPPTPPAKPITGVTLGVGGSSIVIDVSEDAWMGDAQFTLAVDGAQIGGVQTAAALHSLGQTQAFTLDGDFGPGAHTVTATFLNDAYGGTSSTDRNLYVDSIGAGGATNAVNAALMSAGSQNFTATLPSPPTPPAKPITGVTLGAGGSSIVIDVSEDAWMGDAQFTLAVDGAQTGGVQTAAALHSLGQTQAFTLDGDFGPGAHTVTATFLNDAYGGTSSTDRNLYVDSIGAGGATNAVNAALLGDGSVGATATVPGTAVTGVTLGTGSASIVVDVSEDAWMGDAQFTLAVDGAQIGGVQTATALHSQNQFEAFTLDGDFGAGAHTITATFLNDAYNGTSSTDRNLYVDSIGAGGTTTAVNAALLGDGSRNFIATLPSPTTLNAATATPTGSTSPSSASGQVEAISLGSGAASVTLSGNNTVQAGSGADLFNLISGNNSNDTINNFKSTTDRVHLVGYNLPNPVASVVMMGSDSVLNLNSGTTIIFAHTNNLTASNFF